ncbi:MAG: ABC transporter substrate-binding protein [Armatimonadota bacterium]|nr:ABC transporter substrate-binding protein [Armatimonadota bacterium]MDR7469495.1 ABC transporter substrate-binding protein [Armatimonadota bacterium]MDR7475446.1 ABC transporter substrate-binding protein [Armatimonadota bacterium]
MDRRVWRVLALVAASITLFGVSTIEAQERGVTPGEVVFGSSMPLSGPAAYWGGVGKGMDAYVRYLNDQGGIHGRKLRFVLQDDSYLPPRAVVNVRELVERFGVFAIVGTIGTANNFAIRDYIIASKVLWISPGADSSMWAGFRQKRYLFVTTFAYVHEAATLTRYATEKLGVKSVSVFYQNDLYGAKGLLGVKRAASALKGKVKLASAIPFEVTDTDVSSHALKLRGSEADAVVLYATPRHAALLVREMAKIGYRPRLLASLTLVDPIMFTLAGEAWDEVYQTTWFPLPGHDPKVDETLQILIKYDPALRANPYNALGGVAWLEPFLEGLRRAGRDLTADRFVSAMETIRNWDGQVMRGVTFGPDRRQGTNRFYIVRAEKGRYLKLSDWIEYPVEF